MKIQILDRAKKKKFIGGVGELGMKKIPELLIKTGDRVRAFSGDLSTEQIMEICRLLPIEGVGLYAGKDLVNRSGVREVRLSLDGMHLWQSQLENRNIILTEEQEELWFKGKDIELTEEQGKLGDGFVCVKSFGKIGGEPKTLFGFLPKERRRKSQVI
jgi:NOL1/NOP2/fmu family ribosome biogenesis protein